jgi:hypothetical protein
MNRSGRRIARSPAGLVTWLVAAGLAGPLLAQPAERPGPTLEEGRPQGLPLDAMGREKRNAGWTLAFDNDALLLADRDYDYTGGGAVTLTGRRAAEWPVTLDGALDWFERLVPSREAQPPYFTLHALQLGVLAFTPDDLNATVPIRDDRPYASLLFLSNSRTYIRHPLAPVYQTSFTLGVLGLPLAGVVQKRIHRGLGLGRVPEGWDFQIAEGGEPTLQFNWSAQSLLASNFQAARTEYELKWGADLSAGFITEANASVSVRWGRINTPWWSFTPERVEYLSQPAPVIGGSVRPGVRELYVWAGVKARARAYNVFLQGQFRDSEVTFESSRLNHLIGEAWFGVTWQVSQEYRLSYVVRHQSSELKEGAGSRTALWAGVLISRDL